MRIEVAVSDPDGGADQFLFVGSRKVERQAEADAPEAERRPDTHENQEQQRPGSARHTRSLTGLTRALWAAAVLLGALQASVTPYRMSTEDAVSYLDVADGFRQGRPDIVVNGYWSPLYPAILAAAQAAARIPRSLEFPMVRAVNFAIFLLTIAAFEYFLRQVIESHEAAVARSSSHRRFAAIPRWMWIVGGYSLFLWSSLRWTGLRSDTPDLATAALIYAAAGLLLAAERRPWTIRSAALFGVLLACAYHGKAAMFPIALVFIVLAAAGDGRRSECLRRASIALAAFALVAGPFIAALSVQKHRVTFGDSGRINYAWLVNPGNYVIPGLHWQGGPAGFGAPKHPSRRLWPQPELFEFNHPFGTFPPWSDPSYWYDGLELHLDIGAQVRAIGSNLRFYRDLFAWPLVAFYVVLFVFGGGTASVTALAKDNWRLMIPAVAVLGLYAAATNLTLANIPTQPASRYLAAALVLMFSGAISGIRLPDVPRSRRLLAVMTSIVAAVVGVRLGVMAVNDARALREPYREEELPALVTMLRAAGLEPGNKVAILGRKGDHEFWARMSGVQIVSQMADGDAYQRTDDRWRAEIRSAFASTGATLMVYRRWFPVRMPPEWQQLGDTQYWVCALAR